MQSSVATESDTEIHHTREKLILKIPICVKTQMNTIFKLSRNLPGFHKFSHRLKYTPVSKSHITSLSQKQLYLVRDENYPHVDHTELSLSKIQYQLNYLKDDLMDARFIRTEQDLLDYIENDIRPTLTNISNLQPQKKIDIGAAINCLDQPLMELSQKINLMHIDPTYYSTLTFKCLVAYVDDITSIIDYTLDVLDDNLYLVDTI